MMTRRQSEVLAFIRSYIAEHGISPSYTEIGAALGIASKSHIHRIINALEHRGMIRRQRYVARGLEVVEDTLLHRALRAVDEVGDYATVAAYQDAIRRAVR